MGEHHQNAEHELPDQKSSRRLMFFGQPKILQDWDANRNLVHYSHDENQYWELFLDLLLVAAASAVTDEFKDNLNVTGLGEFVVFTILLLNSWISYTNHITSRFLDNSLFHSILLYFFIIGFGFAMVNPGYGSVEAFCWGAIIQRVSLLSMLGQYAIVLPRSRDTGMAEASLLVPSICLLLIVALFGKNIRDSPALMACLWIAAAIELFREFILSAWFTGDQLYRIIPLNIEHEIERLGSMELISLGETVLSVALIYREILLEDEEIEEDNLTSLGSRHPYYMVLAFSFLLVFMILLLYGHMQPMALDNAVRRSRWRANGLYIVHKLLALTILAIGVSVKLVVESVLSTREEFPPFASGLMGYGVGLTLFLLFIMRVLHYGGRESIKFAHVTMYYGRDEFVDRIAYLWWFVVGISGFIPVLGMIFGLHVKSPLEMTVLYAMLVFALVLIGFYFAGTIQQHILFCNSGNGECKALRSADIEKCDEAK